MPAPEVMTQAQGVLVAIGGAIAAAAATTAHLAVRYFQPSKAQPPKAKAVSVQKPTAASLAAPLPPAPSLEPAATLTEAKGKPDMSLFSQTAKNLVSWFSGKIDFNTLEATELQDLRKVTASLPPAAQDGVNAMIGRMASNASAVGQIAGQALAPLLNETADQQATQVQAALTALGVNPVAGTPLTALEHAALATVITGMHATLDRVGIAISHLGVAPVAPQPAQTVQTVPLSTQ